MMPLFKVSVESDVPASAIVMSTAPTEAEALIEVRLLQSRARVNWYRGLTAIGAVEAPYEIWAQEASTGWTVSLYALIPISAILALVAEDSVVVSQKIADRQSSGLIKWTYRGIPIGEYKEPIPTYWSNQQPDEPTFTSLILSTFGTYPGQSVTLSSDVTGENTPVGNLEFRDTYTNTLIIPTTLESDPVTEGLAHAQATVVLPSGVYSVQAVFLGSDGYNASSSILIVLTIAKIASVTTALPPEPPVYAGQSASIDVIVTHPIPSAAKPTGTITLFEGLTVIGSTPLTPGEFNSAGSFSLAGHPPGIYSFTVQYSGDAIHDGSTSAPIVVEVIQVITTTEIEILASNSDAQKEAAVFSEAFRLRARVISVVLGTVPIGTVDFWDNVPAPDAALFLGSASLVPDPDSGDNVARADLLISDLTYPINPHPFFCEYSGNASFAPSASVGFVTLSVSKASVSVNAFSSNSPTVFGQTAFFDATVGVQPPGTVTPFQLYGVGGSVEYEDTGSVTVNFDGTGHATRSISGLLVGTNAIGVSFLDLTEFNPGFTSFPHVVMKANTVSFVDSIIPTYSAWYDYFTIYGETNVVAPGVGPVSGTMNFSIYDPYWFGDLFLGSVAMSGGQAQLYTNFFAIVTDYFQVTVTFVENGSFNTSSASEPYLVYGFYF